MPGGSPDYYNDDHPVSGRTADSAPGQQEEKTGSVVEERTLVFIRELKNITKKAGEPLKVKCEVKGSPPATGIEWFKNEAPLLEEQGRVKVKDKLKGGSTQWSQLRFRDLETLDKGFYRCEATNGKSTIKTNFVIIVNVNSGQWKNQGLFSDPDYGHLPQSFQDPFKDHDPLANGIDNLPIEFQGRSPPDFSNSDDPNVHFTGGRSANSRVGGVNLPSLKPNEEAGRCQKYLGSTCANVVGDNYVFVSADQHYVEGKLSATFNAIMHSSEMSERCREFAKAAVCHSTFPLCDVRTQKPRKLCRDECEVLEQDICKTELAIAKSHPMIGHQMGLPECGELPPIGSRASHNCVKMNIPNIGQLIKPHSCYTDSGEEYRGTHSMTRSGLQCKPWGEQIRVHPHPDNMELIGGHNYCRNPAGEEQMSEPWCFTDDHRVPKQVGRLLLFSLELDLTCFVPGVRHSRVFQFQPVAVRGRSCCRGTGPRGVDNRSLLHETDEEETSECDRQQSP